MKFSISRKILLIFVLSIMALGVFLGIYFVRYERLMLLAEFDARTHVLLNSMTLTSEYPVLTGNKDAIEKIGQSILNEQDVAGCVISSDKEELFHGENPKSQMTKEYEVPITTLKFTGDAEDMILSQTAKGRQVIGHIRIMMSLDKVNQKIKDMQEIIVFWIFIGIILVSVLLTFLVQMLLTRPIRELIGATERIAAGNLTHKVAVYYNDELGMLATAFNHMTDDLQKVTVSKDYVDNIVASMKDGLVVMNLDWHIQTVNDAILELTGYTREYLIGKIFFIFLSDDKLFQDFVSMWQQKDVKNYETHIKRADGEMLSVLLSCSIMQSKNEKKIVCIIKDITERKRAEDELKNAYMEIKTAQAKLVQSEKMASIGQLAAGVAHEINNPIGFISNNMEMLQQYVGEYTSLLRMVESLQNSIVEKDMEKARNIVQEMVKFEKEIDLDYTINDVENLLEHTQRGIERVQKIVMDLKTFAREDNDNMDLIKIEEVIDNILNIVRSELKYKAEIKKDYGSTPFIKCNTQKLGQVFINLFVNASHAIQAKGMIEIRTYVQDNFVCVDVSDTGVGIPPENIKKIFDPFFTTKPIGQGTGLGLSISYEIIKKQGGEIHVHSKVGEGTTFTIMIPVAKEN